MLFSGVEMNFSWISNRENQELIFNFNFNQSLDKNQWFLIGFLNGKRVSGADFCLFKDGTVADGFINSQNELKMDKNQDCEIVESKDSKISIKRKWITCDPHDYAFESGTTQVLFALETGTPEKLPADHHVRHFRFFDKVFPVLDSEDHKGIVFAVENVSFKADTSWCVLTKLDSDVLATKKHIVGWEPVITPGNEAFVEKIEVFWCRYDQESTIASSLFCDSNMAPLERSNCTVPLAVWTASQPKFEFPSKAGQPFGGKNSLSWILIKVTYSKITSKITDSSGLKVIYTEKLRKHDSGILQVGISDISDAVIPPKQSDLILNGFCVSNCSEKLGEKEIH
uniref:Copper type II ascorbate-dependent monooxygenase N-terminal domain-containing protein n=1 Tax=Panagrolaimus sp. JU765 TaxID=591449 RepID=A0AC34QX54_9BILA